MKYKKLIFIALAVAALVALSIWYLHDKPFALFESRGVIAHEERKLMVFTLALSLVVVIPVFALLIGIVWRYRDTNQKKARYDPTWDHNRMAETIWWLIPTAIITVLAIVTWQSTHQLDPYRPIASTVKPVKVQVVALDWKWLFIYPDERIATVNFVQLPVNTPVDFEITSAGPMNSFWIPQLAGQIYAMSGMSSQLHVMADQTGDYRGSSANLSGKGFAGMTFITRVSSTSEYYDWVQSAKTIESELNQGSYDALALPSQNNPETLYGYVEQNLYDTIVMKDMGSTHTTHQHGADE
ncbi:MAG: Ubiquinol oxidase subunit 2 [Candidatus Saccharibacteria bacterium]|nr:Ubiquinol oxidase subunit 2 [Candidatus Saccharibacteria bacterium]